MENREGALKSIITHIRSNRDGYDGWDKKHGSAKQVLEDVLHQASVAYANIKRSKKNQMPVFDEQEVEYK